MSVEAGSTVSVDIPDGVGLAVVAGRPVALSETEHGLLAILAARPGRVLRREELYTTVWRRPLRRGDRLLDVYVRKLRVKLGTAAPGWEFIHTHTGLGYRFEPRPSPTFHEMDTAW